MFVVVSRQTKNVPSRSSLRLSGELTANNRRDALYFIQPQTATDFRDYRLQTNSVRSEGHDQRAGKCQQDIGEGIGPCITKGRDGAARGAGDDFERWRAGHCAGDRAEQ